MADRRRARGTQGRLAHQPKLGALATSHHSLATGADRLMQTPCGLVTLLTDFGLGDPFVGVMKGVLFQADPALRVIDLTHGIGPGAVTEGALPAGGVRAGGA